MLHFDSNSDFLILSTGTKIYAHRGIIGIKAVDNEIGMLTGYDGGVKNASNGDDLTTVENLELIDHMISQWEKIKKTYLKEVGYDNK